MQCKQNHGNWCSNVCRPFEVGMGTWSGSSYLAVIILTDRQTEPWYVIDEAHSAAEEAGGARARTH
jgi:hypothetical protein